MTKGNSSFSMQQGASAVITHRVNEAQQAAYEEWLDEIGPACRASAGALDWHLIRPIAGYSDTYSVIIRYDSEHNLKQWMASENRQKLIAKVENLLNGKDSYQLKSGLDFLFVPEAVKVLAPVRWKQFLLTWSAIFPLVTLVTLLASPAMDWLDLPQNRVFHTFVITGIVVALMVYVVMPRYTRLVRGWLHR